MTPPWRVPCRGTSPTTPVEGLAGQGVEGDLGLLVLLDGADGGLVDRREHLEVGEVGQGEDVDAAGDQVARVQVDLEHGAVEGRLELGGGECGLGIGDGELLLVAVGRGCGQLRRIRTLSESRAIALGLDERNFGGLDREFGLGLRERVAALLCVGQRLLGIC